MTKETTDTRLTRLEVKLEVVKELLEKQSKQLDELNNSIPRLHNDISTIGSQVVTLNLEVKSIKEDVQKNTEFRHNYDTEKKINDKWVKFLGIGSLGGMVGLVLGVVAIIREFFIHGT